MSKISCRNLDERTDNLCASNGDAKPKSIEKPSFIYMTGSVVAVVYLVEWVTDIIKNSNASASLEAEKGDGLGHVMLRRNSSSNCTEFPLLMDIMIVMSAQLGYGKFFNVLTKPITVERGHTHQSPCIVLSFHK
ncbi:hypothetical protein LENED_002434 [Lentinula edodes]|uniref:Uncharacterized protein n=1 Tax=Lentinula edodes TaxID=5353 RepID=A0A1Q3E1H5_LENED|nr:hypothetical protein LENED_002434 [Lentinula edodes]